MVMKPKPSVDNFIDAGGAGELSVRRASQVNINLISPGPNIRESLPQESIDDMVKAITSAGRIQDALEIYKNPNLPGHFIILDGFRRFTAATVLKMEELPCNLVDEPTSEVDRIYQQLVFNEAREGVSLLDGANAIRQLLDAGESRESIETKTGYNQSRISRFLQLLDASPVVKKAMDVGAVVDPQAAMRLEKAVKANPEAVKTIEKVVDEFLQASKETQDEQETNEGKDKKVASPTITRQKATDIEQEALAKVGLVNKQRFIFAYQQLIVASNLDGQESKAVLSFIDAAKSKGNFNLELMIGVHKKLIGHFSTLLEWLSMGNSLGELID